MVFPHQRIQHKLLLKDKTLNFCSNSSLQSECVRFPTLPLILHKYFNHCLGLQAIDIHKILN